MAAMPYMPLFIADYQADTGHLTTLEHGAYLLLIMCYWQQGKPLPSDDRKLARICKLDPRQWARIKPTILEFFEPTSTTSIGQLRHTRLERELALLRDKSLKKRKGGLARAQQMLSERSARGQLIVGVGDIPLAKANGADGAFWTNAKDYLAPFVGKSQPGKLIGKWSRDYGQEATAQAITAAQIARAVEPVPYIEKTLRRQASEAEEVPIV